MAGNTWGESWGIAGAFAWGDSWGFTGFTPPVVTPTVTPTGPGGVGAPPRRRARYKKLTVPERTELDALEQHLAELKAEATKIDAAKETKRSLARSAFVLAQIGEAETRRVVAEAQYAQAMREYALEMAMREEEELILLLLM